MPPTDELTVIERVQQNWAANAVAFADVLAAHDPGWGTEWFAFSGGVAVLCGPGLYVNRALAAGFDGAVPVADFELLEARSIALGLPPEFEVSPATYPEVRRQLAERRYRPAGDVQAFRRSLDHVAEGSEDAFVIERADGALLPTWQDTAATGWGHLEPEARRASNAFSRAAAAVDGPGFLIAREHDDGRPVGCASLTVREGIATLGGMATIPAERGRGVQTALIGHRLRMARAAGCRLATSTTIAGSTSARNLERGGFEPWFTTTTYERPQPAG